MTENDILDAIGDIDPTYLEEVQSRPGKFKRAWIGVASLAACLILFLIPLAYQHYMRSFDDVDYSAEDYTECFVYYVKDHAVYYESAGVRGGDREMFEVWKNKNGIAEEAVLQNVVFSPQQDGTEDHADTVSVTLPASLRHYFENEDGAWRREALKKTLASYRNVTIDTIELIFV